MPNRLATETSPYLQQHADNPVDWYPWGAEAFERARAEGKPVLLSVGYAACHWCHVMAHESFEDEETARLMNEHFVSIKVDREERPDVDSIYMQAVQAMTGHGGWPMTVFLTPAGEPFYGGTYFPPEDRHGMPSFRRILLSVADAYRRSPERIAQAAAAMQEIYDNAAASMRGDASGGQLTPLTATTLERAYRSLAAEYDAAHGGFGDAPKFPHAMAMDFLLRHWRRTDTAYALDMVLQTFRRMARGGIYDQVGGGFARYSTDALWLVPHFEKMLYDNALLARLGVRLWQATEHADVRRVTEETLDWARREMTSPGGAFYSTLDADSEGREGWFYVWDDAELDRLLGDDAPVVKQYWGVTRGGNFEGRNVLHVPNATAVVAKRTGREEPEVEAAVARARAALYDVRAQRVWPGRDEKILAGWNGLMLRAMAEAARAFGRSDYREAALANGEFMLAHLVRASDDGRTARVMRVHKDGATRIPGFLEDHAAVALGFVALYELTFDRSWLDRARAIAAATVEWFWDDDAGTFFDTARDAEALVTRPRDVTDNAVPAGSSLAVELQLYMAELFGDDEARRRASRVLDALAEPMARHGLAFGHLLGAADMAVNGAVEIALVGDPEAADFRALAVEVGQHFVPSPVVAGGPPREEEDVVLLAARPMVGDVATAYLCKGYVCERPVTGAEELGGQLEVAR